MARPAAILDILVNAQTGKASAELKKFDRNLKTTAKSMDDTDRSAISATKSTRGFSSSLTDANQRVLGLKNAIGLVKFPAFIAGAGGAAQAISALGAGAVGLTSALAPLTGALTAYPAILGAFAQAMGVTALASIDDVTAAVGGLREKLDETSDEFKNLSPEAQELARQMQALKAPIRALQRDVQEPLFSGMADGIRAAAKNLPSLNRVLTATAGSLGFLAREAGEFVGRRGFGRDFEKIGLNNARSIRRMGQAGLNLGDALRHVMVEARPLINFMTDGALLFSQWAKQAARAGRESGDMAKFFAQTENVIRRLVSIGGSLTGVFREIGSAAAPLGRDILRSLDRGADSLERWAESTRGRRSLRRYFEDAKRPLYEMGKLIRDVSQGFFDLANTPGLPKLIRQFRRELLPALLEMTEQTTKQFGPVLIDFLTEATKLLTHFVGSNGTLTLFVKGLTRGAELLNKLFEEIPALATVASAALTGFSLYKLLGIGTALRGLGSLGGRLGGLLGKTTTGGIGGALNNMKPIPVFVTNQGFGRPGGGAPTGPGPTGRPTPVPPTSPKPGPMPKGPMGGAGRAGGWAGALVSALLLSKQLIDDIPKGAGAAETVVGQVVKKMIDLRSKVKALADAGKGIPVRMIARAGLDPKTLAEAGVNVLGLKNRVQVLRDVINQRAKAQFGEALQADGTLAKGAVDKMIEGVKSLPPAMRQQASKAMIQTAEELRRGGELNGKEARRLVRILEGHFGEIPKKAEKAGKETNQGWSHWLGKAAQTGRDKSGELRKAVTGNVDSMANAVGGGMQNINKNVGKAMKAFGVEWKGYAVDVNTGKAIGGLQRGGAIDVPGSGTGDRVRALLEPGEVIVNKRAAAALGGAKHVDRINQIIPRFQAGGMVDPRGPGTGVVNEAIAETVGDWSTKYNAAINWGYDPGGGHQSPGHNVTGTATDTSPAGGWVGASLTLFENGLRAILGSVDQILYGTAGIGTPYPNHGRGNHAHIEWGMSPGGIKGAIAEKIKRIVLEGPDGPLKEMGQAALDKARAAANKFIEKKAPVFSGGGEGAMPHVPGGSFSVADMESLWTKVNRGQGDAHLMAAIGMAESSGNPSVTNSIGARGLWQIIPSTAAAFNLQYDRLTDPAYNALGAGRILAGQGLGAWEAYTNGAYQRFMAKGGIVQALQEGGIAGKDGNKLIPNFGEAVRAVGGAGEDGTTALKRLMKAIGRIGPRGVSDEGLVGRMLELDTMAADYATFADEAATQTKDFPYSLEKMGGKWNILWGDEGQVLQSFGSEAAAVARYNELIAPLLGKFRGQTEEQWRTSELDKLAKLRDLLLQAKERIAERRKQLEPPKGLIGIANKKLRKMNKEVGDIEKILGKEGKTPKDWKGIDPVTADAKQWNDQEPKKRRELQKKFKRDGGKLPGDRDWGADGVLYTREANPGRFPDPDRPRRIATALDTKIIPGLEGALGKFVAAKDTVITALDDVQGPRSTMKRFINGAPLPQIGDPDELGNRIRTSQLALLALGAKPEITITPEEIPDTTESVEILKQMLTEAQQRTAVSQAQYGVFAGMPVLGALAKGGPVGRSGMYLVGEHGPEVVGLQQGAQVYSNQQSQAMIDPSATVIVNGDITNVPPGMAPVEVLDAKATVRAGSRGYGKRVLPGARGR